MTQKNIQELEKKQEQIHLLDSARRVADKFKDSHVVDDIEKYDLFPGIK